MNTKLFVAKKAFVTIVERPVLESESKWRPDPPRLILEGPGSGRLQCSSNKAYFPFDSQVPTSYDDWLDNIINIFNSWTIDVILKVCVLRMESEEQDFVSFIWREVTHAHYHPHLFGGATRPLWLLKILIWLWANALSTGSCARHAGRAVLSW